MNASRHQMFISNTHRLRQRPNPDHGSLQDLQQKQLLSIFYHFSYWENQIFLSSSPPRVMQAFPTGGATHAEHRETPARSASSLFLSATSRGGTKIQHLGRCWLLVVGSCFSASIHNSQTSQKRLRREKQDGEMTTRKGLIMLPHDFSYCVDYYCFC